MNDRIPTRVLGNGAIRYGVYDGVGNFLRYEYIKLEDEPTKVGTPINKATLLSDATAALLGGDGNMLPDDALRLIAGKVNNKEFLTVSEANNHKFTTSYSGYVTSAVATAMGLSSRYYHIIGLHYTTSGFGAQIAVSLSLTEGAAEMLIRNSSDVAWGPWANISDRAKITSGTYIGTGTTSKTLTFPFTPKAVIVSVSSPVPFNLAYGGLLWSLGAAKGWTGLIGNAQLWVSLTWGANSVAWGSPNPDEAVAALNATGTTYAYVAFG